MGATGAFFATYGPAIAGAASAGAAIYTATKSAPKAPTPPLMPSEATTIQAQTLQEAQAAATRNGRASTILTNNNSQPASDQLGP
jgi:hypothetical protein